MNKISQEATPFSKQISQLNKGSSKQGGMAEDKA
jgi:hypothetical protein